MFCFEPNPIRRVSTTAIEQKQGVKSIASEWGGLEALDFIILISFLISIIMLIFFFH